MRKGECSFYNICSAGMHVFKLDKILVEKNASSMKMDVLGVYDWATWEKEVSEFPWEYSEEETCYILRPVFSYKIT